MKNKIVSLALIFILITPGIFFYTTPFINTKPNIYLNSELYNIDSIDKNSLSISRGLNDTKGIINNTYAEGPNYELSYNTTTKEFTRVIHADIIREWDNITEKYVKIGDIDKPKNPDGNYSLFGLFDVDIIQPANGQDTSARSPLPTTNYGTGVNWGIGDPSNYAGGESLKGLIKFDLTGIDSSAIVSNTVISLYESAASKVGSVPEDCNFDFNRVLLDWVESQATWNIYSTGNNWNTAGWGGADTDIDSDVSATVTLDSAASNGYIDWSGSVLTDDVQAYINGTYANNYGWGLRSLDCEFLGAAEIRANTFYTSDFGDSTYDPKITITYTIPPPPVYLTVFLHTGIATLLINGSSKSNDTETIFVGGQTANLTSTLAGGYNFDRYEFGNTTVYSYANPAYLLMWQNETIHAYATATTTTTTAAGPSYAGGGFLLLGLIIGFMLIFVLAAKKGK